MRDPFNVTWIDSGKVLAGSMPTSVQDIEALKTMGIKVILSLTRGSIACSPEMREAVRSLLIEHLPIVDHDVPDDLTLNFAIEAIHLSLFKQTPIFVHCRGGIGRTGTILIAYYVLKQGYSLEEARNKVRIRRNYQGNACAADQGSPQREWLDALPQRFKNATA